MNPPAELVATFAPTGTLRAAINLGNPLLAHIEPATGAPGGVSVDLAAALAAALGVSLSTQCFTTAAKAVEAVTSEHADIGFFAIDPLRGAGIAFTAPYVLIEGCYMVPQASPLQSNGEVDRAGHRVAVGLGSAYDLYLSREIKEAQLVRTASSQTVVDDYVAQGLEVAAGVKQQLQADSLRWPGQRLLPGHFMVIQQAMGLPKTRGAAAHGFLAAFVEQAKTSGSVAAALRRHGIEGASVAPAV